MWRRIKVKSASFAETMSSRKDEDLLDFSLVETEFEVSLLVFFSYKDSPHVLI